MKLALDKNKTDKLLFWIAMFIMAAGIIVRLVVLIQNRNLIIDECNIARNIYERNFITLAEPLSYEQYAPPIFLWIVKLFTLMFGMGEQVLRLYPLLTGIGAIIMLYFVLQEYISLRALWYPLVLFASGYIFIRYSTEVKQYMPDIFISLSLIWLALKVNIASTVWYKFVGLWLFVGTVAIWASMPSVFMLSGVGVYYGLVCLQSKSYKKLSLLVIIALLWLAQFVFYYYAILKPQIESDYLQNFHKDFFLFFSLKPTLLKHNYEICSALLGHAAGYWSLSMAFHIVLIIMAITVLLYKQIARAALLVVPILAVIVAAMAHQYSLIPRVALFMMPLLLILIGYGFELLIRIRFIVWRLILVLIALICVKNYNSAAKMIQKPFSDEEFTTGLRFFKKEHIAGEHLYIHNGSRPALIYYTQISPDKNTWAQFKDAHLLYWGANYDSIAANTNGRIGLIFTSVYNDELTMIRNTMEAHLTVVAKLDDQKKHRVYAYVYQKK